MRAESFFFGTPFESEFDKPPGFMGGVAVQEEQEKEEEEQPEQAPNIDSYLNALKEGTGDYTSILQTGLVDQGYLPDITVIGEGGAYGTEFDPESSMASVPVGSLENYDYGSFTFDKNLEDFGGTFGYGDLTNEQLQSFQNELLPVLAKEVAAQQVEGRQDYQSALMKAYQFNPEVQAIFAKYGVAPIRTSDKYGSVKLYDPFSFKEITLTDNRPGFDDYAKPAIKAFIAYVAGQALPGLFNAVLPEGVSFTVSPTVTGVATAGATSGTTDPTFDVSEATGGYAGPVNMLTANADAEKQEETTEEENTAVAAAVAIAVDGLTKPEDNETVVAANATVTAAETTAQAASNNVAATIEETDASVASFEGYANYARQRYGVFSSVYRNAKKRADAAKLEAEREVDTARRKELEAQAEVENAKKAQAGAVRDAEDAYRIEQVNATRAAEATTRQKIAADKEQRRIERTTDTDGDGIYDVVDLFPDDANEWQDTDGDGMGDNAQQALVDSLAAEAAEIAAAKAAKEAADAKIAKDAADAKAAKDAADAKAAKEAADAKAAKDAADAKAAKAAKEAADAKAAKEAADAKARADKIKADAAAAAAAEKEAPAYTEVEATPEGGNPLEADTSFETEGGVTNVPVDDTIKEDIAEPPKYPEKEEVIEETTESSAGGSGGGGAGEGAGAGQGGDTGADAEVGTTTAAETGESGAADTGSSSVPKEERWSYLGNNQWIRVKDIPVYLGTGLGVVEKPNWPDLEPGIYTVTPKDIPPTGSGDRVDDLSVTDSAEIATSTAPNTPQEDNLFNDIVTAISIGTGTSTGTTGTDATSTATTSTGTAGASTTAIDTTIGGAGTGADLGTSDTTAPQDQTGAGANGAGTGTTGPTDEVGAGDADATGAGTGAADATGTGTGASGTPGVGSGDVGDPSDVGEGTGTGAGTGSGTGGGDGSGDGTGTGSGVGAGAGLAVGLAAGMLRPQGVTKTLFEDYMFTPTYQAPQAVQRATMYKTPEFAPSLFRNIIG